MRVCLSFDFFIRLACGFGLTFGLLSEAASAQAPPTAVAVTGANVVVDTFPLASGKIVHIPRGLLVNPQDTVRRMPITMMGGLMFVTATVDGQTGLFIVDTGNPVLILNITRVKPGKVIDSAAVSDAVGRNVEVLVHAVDRFAWGDIDLRDVGALGMDLSEVEWQLRDRLNDQHIFGMIGLAQLAQFLPVVDYAGKNMELYPRSAGTSKSRVKLPKPLTTAPLTVTRTGIFIPGTAGGRNFMLRLDSGDDSMGIDSAFAVSLGTHVKSTNRAIKTLGVGGVVMALPVVTLDQLTVGALRLENIEMRSHHTPPNPMDNGLHAEGNLGSPFFEKHRLGFDLNKKVMYIWANEPK